MKREEFAHPALEDMHKIRHITVIVDAIIYQTKWVVIISSRNNKETNIIFIPKKRIQIQISTGQCISVKGEDRNTNYYGDIVIANNVTKLKPSIDLFALYATYNFPYINSIDLKNIISMDHQSFASAVIEGNLEYFTKSMKLNRYLGVQLLAFSRLHLDMVEYNEAN